MAKLHYIGSEEYLVNYKCNSNIAELQEWFIGRTIIQFDTETTKTESIVERELRVIQIGNLEGDDIFVIQVSYLSNEELKIVWSLINNNSILKIIHNASFDYQIALKSGFVLENVWDTMVMEKCLYAGYDYDLRFFSLAEVLHRRYYIDISKEMQCEFGDNRITDEKLIYAATDVVHLGRLFIDQKADLQKEDLIQLGVPSEFYEVDGMKIPAITENEVVLAFADIEYYGMGFDSVKWRENIAKAQPIVDKSTIELNNILLQEPYKSKGLDLMVKAKLVSSDGKERTFDTKAILDSDEITINFSSPAQVVNVLKYIFPTLEKASASELKKFLFENDPKAPKYNSKGKDMSPNSKDFIPYIESLDADWFTFIKLIILKKFDVFKDAIIMNFRDRLVDDNYLLPKESVLINWNSQPTKLEVFKWFNPDIQSTDAETVENNLGTHPFFKYFQEYQFANSLVTKYGEKFIEKNLDSDNRVRTRFDTILSTGRVSSSSPKLYWAA